MRGRLWIAIGVLVVLALAGCGAGQAGTSTTDDSALSPTMVKWTKMSMAGADKVSALWNGGNYTAAVKKWKAISDAPVLTTADSVLADDVLAYLNNLRYFMVGDGSVDLKELESSREKAAQTLASLR
jgi:hypothetical protein